MDKIEKIKEWVKNRKKETLARNSIGVITGKAFFVDANELLLFIDTLSEEPDNDASFEASASYGTQKYTPSPSVDIGNVARVQFAAHAKVFDKKRKAVFGWEQFKEVASIFYAFGKKDSETKEKEEPDKSLEVELEKESPKELDEMIDDYFKSLFPNIAYYKWRTSDVYVHASPDGIRFLCDHFYELGQSQMPMPEDTVLFQKGVEEGRRLEREDMMNDAIPFYEILKAVPSLERENTRIIVLKDESK